jgi:ABC-type lipoprotein release transport system permease subunit
MAFLMQHAGHLTADPPTFIGVSVLFAAVVLASCCAPVRRSVQVDPIEALRYE